MNIRFRSTRKPLFTIIFVFLSLFFGGLGCDSTTAPLTSPIPLTLYPAFPKGLLYVMVSNVGSLNLFNNGLPTLPLVFDTGSAGICIDAHQVFPSNILGPNGFIFNGAHTINYAGITLTDRVASKSFGSATLQGNIGYSTISFGGTSDGAGNPVTTSSMPILFFTVRLNTTAPQTNFGIFGVNDSVNGVLLRTDNSNAAQVSPFKYLTYPSGLHPGFTLSPVPQQMCDIRLTNTSSLTQTECLPQGILSAGVSDGDTSPGWTVQNLISCTAPPTINPKFPPDSYPGFPAYPNYNSCSSNIGTPPTQQPVLITWTAPPGSPSSSPASGGQINPAPVQVDSGSNHTTIADLSENPSGSSPNPGYLVQMTTSDTLGNSFVFSWTVPSSSTASTSPNRTQYLTPLSPPPPTTRTIVGIGLFLTSYFRYDFQAQQLLLKASP